MKLRAGIRRWWRWGAFALALAGIGVLLYAVLQPEPRWTIQDGPKSLVFLSGDVVVTCGMSEGQSRGPVQLWDAATGREVQRFLTDEPVIAWHEQSADNRWLVAITASNEHDMRSLRRVDLRERKESAIDVPIGHADNLRLSRQYEFVAGADDQANGEVTWVIVDTRTGRTVDRFSVPVDANDQKNRRISRADGIFTEDGSWFIVTYVQNGTQYTRITGMRAEEATVLDHAFAISIAPDSQALVVDRGQDGLWIWDLQARNWRCRLDGAPSPFNVDFSSDHRLLAVIPADTNPPQSLKLFSMSTGELHWELPPAGYSNWCFAPDGRSLVISLQAGVSEQRSIFCDVQGKRRVWEKSWGDDFGAAIQFTPDSRAVIASGLGRVAVIDAATGETRYTIEAFGMVQPQADLAAGGQILLVEQRPFPGRLSELRDWLFPNRAGKGFDDPMILHVIEVESGKQLGRLQRDSATFAMAAADAQSVLTVSHQHHPEMGGLTNTIIECWDLPPRIAWPWVLGVPAAVGVVLIAMMTGWRGVRRFQKMPKRVIDVA